ncbi:MAG: glycosyltransferase family 1 protein, partial [Pirellulales bacterium]|nr:glycosyltransferase family 1 protein [Pirellulales bacterium]
DGIDGLVVEPNNHEDLRLALRRIIDGETDWHEMQVNARQRHGEKFSDKAMAAGVASVYRRVLERQCRWKK